MENLVSSTGMKTRRLLSWVRAIVTIATVALFSLTAASDRQGPVWPSEGLPEISGELKEFLLLMKEEEGVSLTYFAEPG